MTTAYVSWHDTFPSDCHGGALTIGNFDGVHRGHQALLAELRRQASQTGGPSVVLTFDPHPLQLLRPQQFPPLLTIIEQRAALLHAYGADMVLILKTTRDLLELRAREFFERVIRDNLQPKTIVPGFNFAFGHNREGTVERLEEYCTQAGLHFVLLPPTLLNDETISSSRVRAALQAGNVALATELLGRRYSIDGHVVEGQRRGQTIGFPTANLDNIATMLPAGGVYAVAVRLESKLWSGAANIGSNPTFGEATRKTEVHIIDFTGDLYGQSLNIEFICRLRETKKFANVTELTEQLGQDVQAARIAFASEHQSGVESSR